MQPSTLCVHGGEAPARVGAPVVLGLERSVIHHLDDAVYRARASGDADALVYGREANPTVRAVEARLAALEGAQGALLFASGQAALHALLLAHVPREAVVVASGSVYGGSTGLLRALLPRLGARLVELDVNDDAALGAALGPDVALVFCESVANPLTQVTDLPRVVEQARARAPRALVAVDATLVSPVGQRPLELGVDVVMHSATKYLGGHSDVLGGVLAGAAEPLRAAWQWRTRAGGAADPEAAWLLERGLKTLALRVERQSANALAVARALAEHPAVEAVHYCGLPGDPEHARARRLLRHAGGLLSFVVAGGDPAAERLVAGLRLFANAASLGGVESLASRPRGMSHVHLSEPELVALGLRPGLVRLACGVEDAADLVADLRAALDALA